MIRQLVLLTVLVLVPATAFAQETAELSDTQRGYNEKGVTAIREGDYAVAISSFESSLTIGEANVTYLNLGRAYQRAGQCMNAKRAYAKVAAAPAVEAPSRAEILSVLKKYSGELPDTCPTKLQVACEDPTTKVAVDGAAAVPCSTSPIDVAPGPHVVTGKLGDAQVSEQVTVAEGDTVAVTLKFAAPEVVATRPAEPSPEPSLDLADTPPAAKRGGSGLRTAGIIVGALGGATLGTGLILENTYVKNAVQPCLAKDAQGDCGDYDRAKRAQTLNAIIYGVGGGLAIVGGVLYLVGKPESGAVGLQYKRGGPGVAFIKSF